MDKDATHNNTGETSLGDETPVVPENNKKYWKDDEIVFLLRSLDRGVELEKVHERFDRSPQGVCSLLNRLFAGKTPCPPDGEKLLENVLSEKCGVSQFLRASAAVAMATTRRH